MLKVICSQYPITIAHFYLMLTAEQLLNHIFVACRIQSFL